MDVFIFLPRMWEMKTWQVGNKLGFASLLFAIAKFYVGFCLLPTPKLGET